MTRQQALTRAATVALATVFMACRGDGTLVSPVTNASAPPGVRASIATTTTKKLDTDTLVVTFRVNPRKSASQALAGGHKIYLSANAICDPQTSGYGPDTWETPCALLQKQITITATSWVDTAGHPFVEFSPALRFNPDDDAPVWLLLIDRFGARDPGTRIVYCTDDGSCIDESLTDPELATQRDEKKGYLYRRIKHFSGYNISSGYGGMSAME